MKTLDEREQVIVKDYYGISGTPKTLEEIGNDFNLNERKELDKLKKRR